MKKRWKQNEQSPFWKYQRKYFFKKKTKFHFEEHVLSIDLFLYANLLAFSIRKKINLFFQNIAKFQAKMFFEENLPYYTKSTANLDKLLKEKLCNFFDYAFGKLHEKNLNVE